jgi:hypothetical protein
MARRLRRRVNLAQVAQKLQQRNAQAAAELREATKRCIAQLWESGMSDAQIYVEIERVHVEVARERGALWSGEALPQEVRQALSLLVDGLLREIKQARYDELCRKDDSGADLSDDELHESDQLFYELDRSRQYWRDYCPDLEPEHMFHANERRLARFFAQLEKEETQ